MDYKILKQLSFGVLTTILIFVSALALITYVYQDTTNAFLLFAMRNHLLIMILMVVIAVIFGFALAAISRGELQKREKETQNLLEIIFRFIGSDERAIIKYLVEHDGNAKQSEIARLDNMNRIRAFRAVQKLVQKDIIKVVEEGKMRHIRLQKDIFDVLQEEHQKSKEKSSVPVTSR